MTTGAWLIVGAVVVVLLLVWTTWTLTRLRRLEARVERAWTALDTQLQRRAGLADELARDHAAAVGEPTAARLAAAAAGVRAPQAGDRELAENALGRELRELPTDLAVPTALVADLVGTGTRVQLARRFYNDAVRDTRELRRRRFARLMRLHARRPLPRFFDIDDEVAEELRGPAAADRGTERP
ncbi:hypothetical protein ACI8AF_17785 [Blastococcus sp. SYSU D00669]